MSDEQERLYLLASAKVKLDVALEALRGAKLDLDCLAREQELSCAVVKAIRIASDSRDDVFESIGREFP